MKFESEDEIRRKRKTELKLEKGLRLDIASTQTPKPGVHVQTDTIIFDDVLVWDCNRNGWLVKDWEIKDFVTKCVHAAVANSFAEEVRKSTGEVWLKPEELARLKRRVAKEKGFGFPLGFFTFIAAGFLIITMLPHCV